MSVSFCSLALSSYLYSVPVERELSWWRFLVALHRNDVSVLLGIYVVQEEGDMMLYMYNGYSIHP